VNGTPQEARKGRPAAGVDRASTAIVAWTETFGRLVARRIKPAYTSSLQVIMSRTDGEGYGSASVGVSRDGDAVSSFLPIP
jgi:hypothetical protein